MEVVVTSGAVRHAKPKLQSNRHQQQTNSQLFTGQMPFLSPNQSDKALKGKISHSTDLLIPSSHEGLPTLSLTTEGFWLSCGSFSMPLVSPLTSVPAQKMCLSVMCVNFLRELHSSDVLIHASRLLGANWS